MHLKFAKINRILCLLLLAGMLFALAVPAAAAAPTGSISLELESADGAPIDGLRVNITRVAAISGGKYQPAEGFESSGISVYGLLTDPGEAAARDVMGYIRSRQLPPTATATASAGKAEFQGVEEGIWLVWCPEGESYTFNPYLVFIPFAVNGVLCYDVQSAPKSDVGGDGSTSVSVLKRWEDRGDAAGKRPASVTVELLCGDIAVDRVELSEQNGWAHTFTGLPAGKYAVRELSVAEYETEINGDARHGFVITNTYAGEKLPETGQHWWPIAALVIAGVGFALLGILELRGGKDGR